MYTHTHTRIYTYIHIYIYIYIYRCSFEGPHPTWYGFFKGTLFYIIGAFQRAQRASIIYNMAPSLRRVFFVFNKGSVNGPWYCDAARIISFRLEPVPGWGGPEPPRVAWPGQGWDQELHLHNEWATHNQVVIIAITVQWAPFKGTILYIIGAFQRAHIIKAHIVNSSFL